MENGGAKALKTDSFLTLLNDKKNISEEEN